MLRNLVKVALAGLFLASVAAAQTTNTNCDSNLYGSNVSTSCTSTTTTYGPTPAQAALQAEQQKELNENSAKLGAALGGLIALKRAQHAQEKNDLTGVVYCRQNPSGSWTFPNKAPMPCGTLERNVVAYCTVNAKTPICKDVAKLPAPSPQMLANPDEERVTVNVVFCQQNPNGTVTTGGGEKKACADELAYMTAFCTVHDGKGRPCEALRSVPVQAAVAQPLPQAQAQSYPVAATPQPAPVTVQPVQNAVASTSQMESVDPAPTQEISIAEAARRNKAAKEAAQSAQTQQNRPQH